MDNMDKMTIHNLKLPCYIGTKQEEHGRTQVLVFDIEMDLDCRPAGKSDDLADSVDYAALADTIAKLVVGRHFQLLENLAEEVAACCLENKLVHGVKVIVTKNSCLASADNVTIEINRRRAQ